MVKSANKSKLKCIRSCKGCLPSKSFHCINCYTEPMKLSKIKVLLIINLVSLTGFQTFVPLYALFAESVGASPALVGIIWSFYSLVMAVMIMIMGRVENHRSKEKFLVLGYFLYAVGAYSFLVVNSVMSLILVLVLNAAGSGIALPAYKTVFARSEDEGRESEEWAWFDASQMLAAASGAALGGIIIGGFGFSGLFIVMGSIQLIAAIIAFQYFYLGRQQATPS